VAEEARVAPTGHGRHDPLRVAEAVDRGGRLAPVLRFCDQCGQLYADLVALTTALSLAAVPTRPRDYTLQAADARRLQLRGLRACWSWLGSARDAVTRPLAISLTTLGLTGLLLTAIPTLTPAAASSAAPDREFAASAPSEAPGVVDPTATGVDIPHAPGDTRVDPVVAEPSATLTLSIGLVAVGGGLFAARRIAGRSRAVR
jgi:hypothetical protein